jgi:anti-sigma factor RsiW
MTCKMIERLMLESEDRALDAEERRKIDDHLRTCAECRDFQAGRRTIREGLRDIRWAELPPEAEAKTRRLCLEVLGSAPGERREAAGRARIPVPVIAAAAMFTILAAVWLAATLGDLTPGESLPATAWAAVAFIAQNVLMLFLAPVVFRAGRHAGDENGQSGQRI